MRKFPIAIIILLISILAIYYSFIPKIGNNDGWEIVSSTEEIEDNTTYSIPLISTKILFENGINFTIKNMVEFEYLAYLKSNDLVPYLIFAGRKCYQCGGGRKGVRVISLLKDGPDPSSVYSYPGELYTSTDNTLIRVTKVFYGQCIKKGEVNIVWYIKALNKDNKWHNSASYIYFKNKNMITRSGYLKYNNIDKTLKLVEDGACQEVIGIKKRMTDKRR